MSFEAHDTLACANIPDLCRTVEGGGHELVSVSIEVKADDFSLMPAQCENLLAGLDVPKLGGVIHTSGGYQHAVRVKGEAHDLHRVALEGVITLAGVRVPNLRLLIEAPGHDFVSEWIIKGHRVHYITVLVQAKKFLASHGVPNLASSIVGACDELIARFVEGTVGKGQQMRAKNFEESELLLVVFHLLLDELFDELP